MLCANLSFGCNYCRSSAVPCLMNRVTGVFAAAHGMERYDMSDGRRGLPERSARPVCAVVFAYRSVHSVTTLPQTVSAVPAFRDAKSEVVSEPCHVPFQRGSGVACISACGCTCIRKIRISQPAISRTPNGYCGRLPSSTHAASEFRTRLPVHGPPR
jgi:hypothetical protein